MDFSLWLFPYNRWGRLEAIGQAATNAESAGFRSVQLADHALSLADVREADGSVPSWPDWSVLGTYIAGCTEHLRILASVVIPYRPVLTLGKQVATLDHVSRGRFTLIACTGWNEPEFEMLGVPFETRGEMTTEYLRVLKELWTSDDPQFSGDFVSVSDLVFEPKCLQKPHVPIWIAGGGGPRPLRRVIEFGTGWMSRTGSDADELSATISRIRDGLRANGRSTDGFVFTQTVFFADESAAASVFRSSKRGSHMRAIGASGSADEALQDIHSYSEAGINELGVTFPGADPGQLIEQILQFGEVIIPAVASAGI